MQFLERNYYHAMIDSVHGHDQRVNATLQLRSKVSILRYLKPVTGNNLPTPDEAGLSATITKEVNQSVETAIAGNRRTPDNRAIGKYAAENGNAAAIERFKTAHDIGESTV